MSDAPNWQAQTIAYGIAKLLALRLQGAPFAGNEEDVAGICFAWFDALQHAPIAWCRKLDESRLMVAFNRLAFTSKRWPTPAQLLEMMPARGEPVMRKLSRQITEEEIARGREELKQIKLTLKNKN